MAAADLLAGSPRGEPPDVAASAMQFARELWPAGAVAAFGDIDASTDGRVVAVAVASFGAELSGKPSWRLGLVVDGTAVVVPDPVGVTSPSVLPDGSAVAFGAGDGVWVARGAGVTRVASLDGMTVESVAWAPGGDRILARVLAPVRKDGDAGTGRGRWAPLVDDGTPSGWRRAIVVEASSGRVSMLSPAIATVWEAAWAGPDSIVAVVADRPDEDSWYRARVVRIAVADGRVSGVAGGGGPDHQVGVVRGSPSGRRTAFIEGRASHRHRLAGRVVVDGVGVECGMDASDLRWVDDDRLFVAGVAGTDSVLAVVDVAGRDVVEVHRSTDAFGSGLPRAAPIHGGRRFVAVRSSWATPPAVVRGAEVWWRATTAPPRGHIERTSWTARDGVRIDGLLVRPDAGRAPLPMVVAAHDGPVGVWRDEWLAGDPMWAWLVDRGYAVLFANGRGSLGRGPQFVDAVVGDVGGAELGDQLSGVDALVAQGVADPMRIGIAGVGHGGSMAAWAICSDDRFAAAVAVSPVTDLVSNHFTSAVPDLDRRILVGEPAPHGGGRWLDRSAVLRADQVRTPILQIAGAADERTHWTQALELHRALARLARVQSELALYPGDGPGAYPAAADVLARVARWMQRFMPAA